MVMAYIRPPREDPRRRVQCHVLCRDPGMPEKRKRHVGDMALCLCESSVVGDHGPQGRALA
jgi:hypothetical protein